MASSESEMGTQSDDVDAIRRYIAGLVTKTANAATLKAQTLAWIANSGWYEKNYSSDWYDELRTRRNQVNIANAVTAADKAAVTQTLTTGLTNEELAGKQRPKIDPVSGATGSQVKKPTVPGVVVGKPPQVVGAPKLTGLLKSGVRNDSVKTWQTFLGLTPPTGYFDALTDQKTRAWQTLNGLKVDGVVGPASWAKAFPIMTASTFAPTSTPSSAASINNAFAKTPGAKVAAAANPVAAASSAVPGTPAANVAAAAGAAVAAARAKEAGMLGSIQAWPVWAKVGAGLGVVGLVLGSVVSHHGGIPQKHSHRYR